MRRLIGFGCMIMALFLVGLGLKFLFFDNKPPTYVEQTDTNYHAENEGKYVLMRGTPTFNGLVEDPKFGVKVKTPLLKRNVEMYQYLKNGTEKNIYMTRGWSSKAEGAFTTKYDKRYSNPSFPEGLRSEDFGGELTLNNGTLKIDKDYAPKFGYSQYVDFKYSYNQNLVNVKRLPSSKLPAGMINNGNSYFRPSDGGSAIANIMDSGNRSDALSSRKTNYKVGDVRITYQAYRLVNMPECTILALQKNGVLTHTDRSKFLDYSATAEDMDKAYRHSSRYAFGGALACAAILFAIGIYVMS